MANIRFGDKLGQDVPCFKKYQKRKKEKKKKEKKYGLLGVACSMGISIIFSPRRKNSECFVVSVVDELKTVVLFDFLALQDSNELLLYQIFGAHQVILPQIKKVLNYTKIGIMMEQALKFTIAISVNLNLLARMLWNFWL